MLKKLWSALSPGRQQHQLNEAYQLGLDAGERQFAATKVSLLKQELTKLVGLPVIGVSQGRVNLIVGVVAQVTTVGAEGIPVPLVSDYIDYHSTLMFGKLFVYTPARLEALSLLSPEQRDILFHHEESLVIPNLEIRPDIDTSTLLTHEQYVQVLTEHNFFELITVQNVLDHLKESPNRIFPNSALERPSFGI